MPNLLPKPVPISTPPGTESYLAIDLETTDLPGNARAELFSVSWLVVEQGEAVNGESIGVAGAVGPPAFLLRPPRTMRAPALMHRLAEMAGGRIVVTYGARLDTPLLEKNLSASGIDTPINLVCVHELARKNLPGAPAFAPRQLAAHLGIVADDVPETLRDVMITARLYEKARTTARHIA